MRRGILGIAAGLAALVPAAPAGARESPVIVPIGPEVTFSGGYSPKVLAKAEPRPFNGAMRGGVRRLWAYAEIAVPTPGAIVMKGELRKVVDGRSGSELAFSVPKIAGGYGSITALEVKLERRYTREGRLLSAFTLTCPSGEAALGATAEFADGTVAKDEMLRTCTGAS
jgi:hypothetical protein